LAKLDDFRSGLCSCDDFGACHDKVTVAGFDFIGRRPIYGSYLQREECFWEPPTEIATWILNLIVDGHEEKFKVSIC
jgi:hypothetical protein